MLSVCVTQDFGQPLMALCVRVRMLSVHLSVCLSVCLSMPVYSTLPSLSCEGCDPGMYLTTNDTCLPCPANSNSTQRGESVCPCFEGYYRAAEDPPEMACTRKWCLLVGNLWDFLVHRLLPSPNYCKCSIFTIAVCVF